MSGERPEMRSLIKFPKYGYLERRFFRSFIDAFNKHIRSQIKDIPLSELEKRWPKLREDFRAEMTRRAKLHLRQILKLGLFEGMEEPRGVKIPEDVMDKYMRHYWRQSSFEVAINLLLERIVPAIVATRYSGDVEGLKNRVSAQMNLFQAVVRNESQFAINTGRELEFRQRDPFNRFRYRWGILRDHRTTPQCMEIAETVERLSRERNDRGLPLEELKQLINYVAVKHDPKWRPRDWVPHYNCRSGLERVVV